MKLKLLSGRYRFVLSLLGVCLCTGAVLALSGRVSSHGFLPLYQTGNSNGDSSMPEGDVSDRDALVRTKGDTGTLEKLIVSTGTASIDLDISLLNGGGSSSRKSTINFTVQPDAFFTVLAFNGEFRGPLPSSMALMPQRIAAAVPNRLNASLNNLVIESLPAGGDYDLAVRDSQSGFTFFNIEGQLYNYGAEDHSLNITMGRLILSPEFASELGRASDAGSLVGGLSVSVMMHPIEIREVVNGETRSAEMPAGSLTDNGTTPGPDVIVGELSGLSQFGSSGTRVGLAVGTDSCNPGTVDLDWFANPSNDHPVIPQNLYRMSGGTNNDERFEQIGQSSMKHAFTAASSNTCGFGCNGVAGAHLGSGCSDLYGSGLNAGPNLGSRAWVNPFTGFYPTDGNVNNNHSGHNHDGISHRIIVEQSDLNTTLNQGASYFAEAQYVTPHEYVWCQSHPTQCNMFNNVSYKKYNVSGTTSFTFTSAGATMRTQPAIMAWTGATLVPFRPDSTNDGLAFIAYKVSHPSANVYHYEYVIYNENLDRAIQSFSIPVGDLVTVSNIGFHMPPQQPGWTFDNTAGNTGFSSLAWLGVHSGNTVSWSSETLAQNPNANAIRWGTAYTFRFDSDRPPTFINATVGFFKTGAPMAVQVLAPRTNTGPCIRYDPETPLSCG